MERSFWLRFVHLHVLKSRRYLLLQILLIFPPLYAPAALFLPSPPQPAAAAAVLGGTGAAAASLGAQPAVLAAAALGASAVSVAQQAPAVVSPVSAEAPGTGAGGGGGGGAKLEASLLANLKKKIKEKAAAPEKLKTTGVAFQAVQEVYMCAHKAGASRHPPQCRNQPS